MNFTGVFLYNIWGASWLHTFRNDFVTIAQNQKCDMEEEGVKKSQNLFDLIYGYDPNLKHMRIFKTKVHFTYTSKSKFILEEQR